MKILTWDLETTGLNPDDDQIVEVGFCMSDGFEIIEESGCLVQPTIEIPYQVTKIHGITTEEARTKGFKWDRVAERFTKKLYEADVWCGYNLDFDIRFLKAGLNNIGVEYEERPVIDIFKIARRFIPSDVIKKKSLSNMCSKMGIQLTNAHRAMHDASATIKLGEEVLKMVEVTLEEAIDGDFKKLGKYNIGKDQFEAMYSGFTSQ